MGYMAASVEVRVTCVTFFRPLSSAMHRLEGLSTGAAFLYRYSLEVDVLHPVTDQACAIAVAKLCSSLPTWTLSLYVQLPR